MNFLFKRLFHFFCDWAMLQKWRFAKNMLTNLHNIHHIFIIAWHWRKQSIVSFSALHCSVARSEKLPEYFLSVTEQVWWSIFNFMFQTIFKNKKFFKSVFWNTIVFCLNQKSAMVEQTNAPRKMFDYNCLCDFYDEHWLYNRSFHS